MKKSFLMAIGACAVAFLMSGCFATHTSDGAYMADVGIAKQYTPVIEHKDAQVSGVASINSLFGIINWGVSDFADNAFNSTTTTLPIRLTPDPLTVVKQGATYKACQDAKADMLLNAKYRIDVKDYIVFKQITCKAVGFPAVVKGLK